MQNEIVSKLNNSIKNSSVTDFRIGMSNIIYMNKEDALWLVSFGEAKILTKNSSNKTIVTDDINSKIPLLNFFKKKVSNLEINDLGDLKIEFSDSDNIIIISSSDEFEAWEIFGPNNFQVVCTPGGKLAIWG